MFVFLLVCALLDDFMSYVLPVDFTFRSFSLVFHICFCALLMFIYDRGWLDRVLIGATCGLLTDLFITDSFPVYMILYALSAYGIGFFQSIMKRRIRFECSIVWGFVFLIDFVPYVLFSLFGKIHIPFFTWILKMELLTMVIHVGIIVVLIYIISILKRFVLIRMHRRKVQEKKQYHKYRLVRK